MKGRRLIVLVALLAAAASGCAPSAPSGDRAPALSSGATTSGTASTEATLGTPPATIAPEASYALPLVGGKPMHDPATDAKGVAQIVKPGAVVVLTPAALRLIGESVEGTMIVTIEDVDTLRKELVARVIRFKILHRLSVNDPPAAYTLPKGTLVRLRLPDARRGEKPIPVAGLLAGDTAALRVRIGLEPGGVALRLLAVDGEGGVTP